MSAMLVAAITGKDAITALNAAQMVDGFNRQLHPDQVKRIQQLNKDNPERAQDALAVLCYVQNCNVDGIDGKLSGDPARLYQMGENLKNADPQLFKQLRSEIDSDAVLLKGQFAYGGFSASGQKAQAADVVGSTYYSGSGQTYKDVLIDPAKKYTGEVVNSATDTISDAANTVYKKVVVQNVPGMPGYEAAQAEKAQSLITQSKIEAGDADTIEAGTSQIAKNTNQLLDGDPKAVGSLLGTAVIVATPAAVSKGISLITEAQEAGVVAAAEARAIAQGKVESNFSRDGEVYLAQTYTDLKEATAKVRAQLGDAAFDAPGKPAGNVATAEINIYGKSSETVQASSRIGNNPVAEREGFVSLPPEGQRILKPINRDGSPIDRATDTEYKILENFAQKNIGNPNVQGNINLYTERAPCESCSNVIERQFAERFPNMEVRLYHGNGEVSLYKGSATQTFMVPSKNKEEWPTIPGGEVVAPRTVSK
jgi:hypothetical protein